LPRIDEIFPLRKGLRPVGERGLKSGNDRFTVAFLLLKFTQCLSGSDGLRLFFAFSEPRTELFPGDIYFHGKNLFVLFTLLFIILYSG
jgi:hypothetical protein